MLSCVIPLKSMQHIDYLIDIHAPSRIAAQDGSLYSFSSDAAQSAAHCLGWSTLSSKPPMDTAILIDLASEVRAEGLEAVVLIGQGGSTQASMTVTKLNALEVEDVPFRTMDSLSPVYVDHILDSSDPAHTLYIVSSKSGSTLEPRCLARVAWEHVCSHIGARDAGKRFVAITDPGSKLERYAVEHAYRAVLPGLVDVGGRYSALSVFALFPMALVGIDIVAVLKRAATAEKFCSQDNVDNPALRLACFLYEGYQQRRDKFSLVMPPSGQVFGLWIEQLVAESLGKDGKGILPNVEVDASILSKPHEDRSAITYAVGHDEGFLRSIECINASIPQLHIAIESASEIGEHFVAWEYAVALCGLLMEVNPFDQPDVEVTKRAVKEILYDDEATQPSDDFVQIDFDGDDGIRTMRVSKAILERAYAEIDTVDEALRALLESIGKGDYFSLNAFVPFRGTGRREALERMRHRVADRLGAASCLEIGPRYLHSTGQLHKGGSDTGVFLLLSADEEHDRSIPNEPFTLGELAAAQAQGDFAALASRGRRAVQIHLTDNGPESLSRFADRVCAAVSAAQATHDS